MKLLKAIRNVIFPPPVPKYGSRIFQQPSWLEKQIAEEMRKRAYGLD